MSTSPQLFAQHPGAEHHTEHHHTKHHIDEFDVDEFGPSLLSKEVDNIVNTVLEPSSEGASTFYSQGDAKTHRPPDAVQLDFFSGPVGLLLHLLKREEVKPTELQVAEVLRQCSSWVHSSGNRIGNPDTVGENRLEDMDRLAEILVVLATLVELKSRLLLPGSVLTAEDRLAVNEAGVLDLTQLEQLLLQQKETLEQAIALRNLPQLGVSTFIRRGSTNDLPQSEFASEKTAQQVSLNHPAASKGFVESLATTYVELISRMRQRSLRLVIQGDKVSVRSCMQRVLETINKHRTSNFSNQHPGASKKLGILRDLLIPFVRERGGDATSSRYIIIGTFIGVLELARRGLVTISAPINDGATSLCNIEAVEIEAAGDIDSSIADDGDRNNINELTSEFD